MEVDDIVVKALDEIKDTSYTATWAIEKINEAMLLVATACLIPGLQVNAPVIALAGSSSVALPRSYLREVFMVTSTVFPQGMPIAPNERELTALSHPDETGNVRMVTVKGSSLLYIPKPVEDETLNCFFYTYPAELMAGDTVPSYGMLPEIILKGVVLNYVIKEAYLHIEDGVDGGTPNYTKFNNLMAGNLAALSNFFPTAPKQVVQYERRPVWF